MSARRSTVRMLGVVAMAGPMAASMLLLAAPAAHAAGSFVSPTPTEDAVLTSSSFTVQASVTSGSASVTLTLTGKVKDATGATSTLCTTSKSSQGGPLSSAQTLSLSACSTAKNAQWTASLSGGAAGTRNFATNVAPSAPSGFGARGSGARDVSFSWSKGGEADLTGYVLYDGSGAVLDANIGLDACSGSSCDYGLYYPTDNAGTHAYQLAAKRASGGCATCGSTLESADKASASATLVNPPPPPPPPTSDPTPEPEPTGGSTGGTTGGTPGGSSTGGSTTGGTSGGTTGGTSGGTSSGGTTGGTTGGSSSGGSSTTGGTAVKPGSPILPSLSNPVVASRLAFALRFNAFSPSLGIPKLPPLPAITLPSISGEAPLPQGTFDPKLPYADQTETEKVVTGTFARPVAAVRDVLDSERLAKSLAGALILLLVGAHLRRFLGTHTED